MIDNKAIDEAMKKFDRRLFYTMQIAAISRVQSEGLFFNMMEGESLKLKIRENYYMLSLGGVYAPSASGKQSKLPIALENMTQNQTQINTVALHLDNDFAGRSATENISLHLRYKYEVRDEPPPYGKDCNDYLQRLIIQKQSRQMGR